MDHLKQLKISSLQQKINRTFQGDTINILSGQGMYDVFKQNGLMIHGDFVPFNEAMCFGQVVGDIFSEPFIRMRARIHDSTVDEYKRIVIHPLKPIFQNQYKCIALWFGADMFCQINMLTVLAYLNQIDFEGNVVLYLVNEHTYEVREEEVLLLDYKKIYDQVLFNYSLPNMELMPFLLEGIRLYIEYQQPNNEMIKYIKQNIDLTVSELTEKMLHKFSNYGLGDLQYIKLIEQVIGH